MANCPICSGVVKTDDKFGRYIAENNRVYFYHLSCQDDVDAVFEDTDDATMDGKMVIIVNDGDNR